MGKSERRFKAAVARLLVRGIHPSPAALHRELGPHRVVSGNLNGRGCRWRREVLAAIKGAP